MTKPNKLFSWLGFGKKPATDSQPANTSATATENVVQTTATEAVITPAAVSQSELATAVAPVAEPVPEFVTSGTPAAASDTGTPDDLTHML